MVKGGVLYISILLVPFRKHLQTHLWVCMIYQLSSDGWCLTAETGQSKVKKCPMSAVKPFSKSSQPSPALCVDGIFYSWDLWHAYKLIG